MSFDIEPKIVRSRRRTLALQILPDSTLIVKAPFFTPTFFINKFIQEHKAWIEKKIELINKQRAQSKKLKNGKSSTILFLGNEYIVHHGDYNAIRLKEDQFLFPQALRFRAKTEITNWYVKQAKHIITTQVEFYAKRMNAVYTDLKFSDTKSQWGRCTHDNKLQFSWRLVMAPLLVINYVVVHELVHTFEKNHSRAFWSKVRLYNPSYRQQIIWLKENGHSLKD